MIYVNNFIENTCFLITKNGLRCFVFLKFVQGASPPNPSPEAPSLDSVGAAPQTPAVARTKSYICGLASLAAKNAGYGPDGGGGMCLNEIYNVIIKIIPVQYRGTPHNKK